MVVPTQRALGVGRVERLLPDAEAPTSARLLLYDDGRLVVVPIGDVIAAPPGPWKSEGDQSPPPRSSSTPE